jgi:peptidoglycan L-alanyl-D-glutamate endopeptidase CwlK
MSFSPRSLAQLATCEKPLQDLFTEVDRRRSCTVIEGVRSQADQDRDFDKGVSKLRWPHGKHNVVPPATLSRAADVKPDDLAWTSPPSAWKEFADLVFKVAAELGIRIRWGGAWNGVYPNPPHTLNDLDHFELLEGVAVSSEPTRSDPMNTISNLTKSTTFHSLVMLVLAVLPQVLQAFGVPIAPNTVAAIQVILGSLGVVNGRVNASGPLIGTPKA